MALSRCTLPPLVFILLAGALPAWAQAMPELRAGQQPLAIEHLDIRVQVVGTLATTTWDLTFRNPQDRILEGELVFPLGEGQSVSRFALPVNGVLREGVVVEKAKGRAAFEEVVRRTTVVDPGLLEKTEGNAFRSRIYPIPARGTYRVVIAFEQELKTAGEGLRYVLPLAFSQAVGDFSLRVEVQEQTLAPIAHASLPGLSFHREGRAWHSEHRGKNVVLNQPLDLVLPRGAGAPSCFIHREGPQGFFYIHLDQPSPRTPKVPPRRLLLVWDASASAARRDLAREQKLLAAYLQRLGHASVDVVVLRDQAEAPRRFDIAHGATEALMAFLREQPLDGGTRLDALDLAKQPADEVLLFSDGLANLGKAEARLPAVPLMAFGSAANTNHALLRQLAETHGGEYLNLQVLADDVALDALGTRPLTFLGIQGAPGVVHDVHPAKGTAVRGGFGLAGRLVGDGASVTLRFGYAGQVVATREVVLQASDASSTPLAARIWAQKKLASLQADPVGNRAEILRLGQAHGIVTEETSLIVLETLQDYVRHRISPPADLRDAYDAQITAMDRLKTEAREARIANLGARFEALKAWWGQDFPEKPKPVPNPPPASRPAVAPRPSDPPVSPIPLPPSRPMPVEPDSLVSLEGRVLDMRGEPIPGAHVEVQGPALGSARTLVTDREGRYRAPLLPQGRLALVVRKEDFTAVRVDLTLGTTSDRYQQDIRLRPIRVQDTVVEVVASAGAVDATETRTATNDSSDSLESQPAARGTIQIAPWQPDTPYLKALAEVAPAERYAAYLNLRKAFGEAPGFYLDMADAFDKAGQRALARRVLSNLAELQLDAPALLRVLGHRLLQLGEVDLAIQIFERVARLREEEPQSGRDLALALAQGGQHQRAADLLYATAIGAWDDRFADVDLIALNELNALVATHRVKTRHYDPRLLAPLPVDIRVVLTWDTHDSDMDLHVTDPRGEVCSYSHARTALGGHLSRDITQGYGPEEFLLRRAIPGTYRIQANYYGTRERTAVVGPTTVKATLILHFGTRRETRKDLILRLDGRGSMLDVGSFEIP